MYSFVYDSVHWFFHIVVSTEWQIRLEGETNALAQDQHDQMQEVLQIHATQVILPAIISRTIFARHNLSDLYKL